MNKEKDHVLNLLLASIYLVKASNEKLETKSITTKKIKGGNKIIITLSNDHVVEVSNVITKGKGEIKIISDFQEGKEFGEKITEFFSLCSKAQH